MNLFSGLEKFGLKTDGEMDLFADEEKKKGAGGEVSKEAEVPAEDSFLLAKAVRCAVCDKVFKRKMVKNGRVKRKEPDRDLRPRFQYIDTLKYNVTSCPFCGYTALNNYFEHLPAGQVKLVKEKICENYKAEPQKEESETAPNDYDTAVAMHKLSLFNAIAKKGKTSEKAYNCLVISWLLRAQKESLTEDTPENKAKKAACAQEEEAFYKQAYEGFMKAVATEMFPMCGMDQSTVDYLLACMAFHFKQYDVASKCLANVITSASANRKIKDKALDMKEEVVAAIHKDKSVK